MSFGQRLAKNRPLLPLDLAADLRAVQNVGTATRAMLPSAVECFLRIKTHHSNLTGMDTQNQWSSFNYGRFWVSMYNFWEYFLGPAIPTASQISSRWTSCRWWFVTSETILLEIFLPHAEKRSSKESCVNIQEPGMPLSKSQTPNNNSKERVPRSPPTDCFLLFSLGFANLWWLDKKSQNIFLPNCCFYLFV